MVTDSWSVAAELTAQYSVLHQFAVGACSRDETSVAKFHRRISVRHVRRGIRCCHSRLGARADYDAICNVCQRVMNEWHGTVGRAYTLKSQSANA